MVRPFMKRAQNPDETLTAALIERYWHPWHQQLVQISQDERVKLVIDAHSMAAVGPTLYSDPGSLRPRINIGNLGNKAGLPHPHRPEPTAPAPLTRAFTQRLGSLVADLSPLAPVGETAVINAPFFGGWNLIAHGGHHQPWLMVEFNRALYIGHQDNNSPIIPKDETRLATLRHALWQTTKEICQSLPTL